MTAAECRYKRFENVSVTEAVTIHYGICIVYAIVYTVCLHTMHTYMYMQYMMIPSLFSLYSPVEPAFLL